MAVRNFRIPRIGFITVVGKHGHSHDEFLRHHFEESEIISISDLRKTLSHAPQSKQALNKAVHIASEIMVARLELGGLCVMDMTGIKLETQKRLGGLAKNAFAPHVNFALTDIDLDAVTFTRRPLSSEMTEAEGPFDIIGDTHGCLEEALTLLRQLGYRISESKNSQGGRSFSVTHPEGRRIVWLGDMVDRGPDSPGVLRLVMDSVRTGGALFVKGNHDFKLEGVLRGKKRASISPALQQTLDAIAAQPDAEDLTSRTVDFLREAPTHLMLDHGRLAVAHAGVKAEMQGRESTLVDNFCMFGTNKSGLDDSGFPVREDWQSKYYGKAMVVYGHTPHPEPVRIRNTVNIDTGCVFGGSLTALRYPENELVQVPSQNVGQQREGFGFDA